MTHRTLRDANTIHHNANSTNFHRSMHDAGLRGGFTDDEPGPTAKVFAVAIGVVALWAFLVVMFWLGE